jgi:hypothetical protein
LALELLSRLEPKSTNSSRLVGVVGIFARKRERNRLRRGMIVRPESRIPRAQCQPQADAIVR